MWSTRTPQLTESLKTVVEVGAGDGKVLSREQVGALLLATSKSSQNRRILLLSPLYGLEN